MGRIVEMPLPRLGETMEEGRIGLILKKPGERFRRGETLLEVESDKTTVEVPALQDGVIVEWLVASDQMVAVEQAIARIEIEGDALAGVGAGAERPAPARAAPAAAVAIQPRRSHAGSAAAERPRASTAARATARRQGIDLARFTGTGRNGRITRADLEAASRPARASFSVETVHGSVFFREWPAQGPVRGEALLIHGLFADSLSFTTLGRKLASRGVRTLAVDLPGHGGTVAAASSLEKIVATLRTSLPAGRFHVIGHSYGAMVAARLQDIARSLTLLAPAGCGEEINGDFIDAMLGAHLDQAMSHLGETIPPEAQAILADHLAVNAGQLRAIARGVTDHGRQTVSILQALSTAACPVRAVFLRDDAVIPAHHVLNLPFNVAVHMMQGASHLPHWRNPDAIAALVTDA